MQRITALFRRVVFGSIVCSCLYAVFLSLECDFGSGILNLKILSCMCYEPQFYSHNFIAMVFYFSVLILIVT